MILTETYKYTHQRNVHGYEFSNLFYLVKSAEKYHCKAKPIDNQKHLTLSKICFDYCTLTKLKS